VAGSLTRETGTAAGNADVLAGKSSSEDVDVSKIRASYVLDV
jgi:hypothetical protein